MPRPGPRRLHTCVRFSAKQLDYIDRKAEEAGLMKNSDGKANRSALLRRLVDEAMKKDREGT